MESWKIIPGYNGWYEASTLGRIRSIDRVVRGRWGGTNREGKIIKPAINGPGYLQVVLCVGKPLNRRVHQLVAKTWLGPTLPGMEVCHNDGIKTNNKLSNLRYGTRSENNLDKRIHGTRKSKKVICDGELFDSITEAAEGTGLSISFVSAVCNREKNSSSYKMEFV